MVHISNFENWRIVWLRYIQLCKLVDLYCLTSFLEKIGSLFSRGMKLLCGLMVDALKMNRKKVIVSCG
jgi:hypothetical protein